MPRPKEALTALDDLRTAMSKDGYRDLYAPFLARLRHAKRPPSPGEALRDLKDSDVFYLTQEMRDLVEWAAVGLDENDSFSRALWPSERGFLYFEDALLLTDARGTQMVAKAAQWAPHEDGVVVTLFCDLDDERDTGLTGVPFRLIRDRLGRHVPMHVAFVPDGFVVGKSTIDMAGERDPYAGESRLTPYQGSADNPMRFLLALLLMLQQTVSETSEAAVNPRLTKRLKKRGLPSTLTVIQMRRHPKASQGDGETRVDWQRRWVVRGHWRWQRVSEKYPAARLNGDHYVARLWVAPHVKGPEDRPLIVSRKVNVI